MSKNWTKSQLDAINAGGRDLLISAGAGSGKTAVLTERIIRRLTDNENPAESTRMLIVTFTKAAASELKERISSALSAALALDPQNKRLSRQLLQLDRAKICTIHSFCLELMRANFAELGIGADFRVADEAEIKLLRRNLMDELIEDYFTGKIPENAAIDNFEEFTDTFTGTKGDDGLADIFLGLEATFASYRESIGFIETFAGELETDADSDFAESRCGAEILTLVSEKLEYYSDIFKAVLPEIMGDAKLAKGYLPAFEYDIGFISEISRLCAECDYTSLTYHINNYTPQRLSAARGVEISTELEKAKSLRDEFKKERQKLAAKFFSLTPDRIKCNQIDTSLVLRKIHRLLSLFSERFSTEKRRRSLVDFNDLERLCAQLLIGGDGKPTETALSTAGQFDEIYIDEYQDVNSLQDSIFAAVSNGNNRFMVGDVKQSIYAFRGAEPGIFQSYRRKFKRLGDPEAPLDSGCTIFLSDNFRCDKQVIDFANLVSERIFTNGTGALPYYPEDNLEHSKIADELGTPVKIAIIDGTEDEDSEDDLSLREAEYVAAEIQSLLASGKKDDGTPIRPSDIAILMRSAKAHSDAFTNVFGRYSIPFYNNVGGDFFENAEVLLALCLLNTIDNPTRDIYLAGALKSPLYGFSLDELILIRRHLSDGSLYDALKGYTAETGFKKGERFLADLARYRRKAEGLPVDKLIWYLYTETNLPALVYDGAENQSKRRRANLTLLYEYARRFEGSSFKGLYNFIRYINDIIEEKAQLENAKIFGEASETIKLMTIHQSKGLEFPVVFICGCAKKFNESDLRKNIAVERTLGIATKLADSTGFARYDTPVRQAIIKKLADSQLEEEMRVLYVAMTRARERLYITGLVSKPQELLEKTASEASCLSRNIMLRNGGYLRWILLALANHDSESSDNIYKIEIISPAEPKYDIPLETTVDTNGILKPDDDTDYSQLIRERFDFVYPHSHAAKIPAKLSVSKLFPDILDEDGSAPLETETGKPQSIASKIPLFLSDSDAHAGVTAAERGTATHLFMQFCDFGRFKNKPSEELKAIIQDECERLREHKFITQRAASLVNQTQLVQFFKSRIFAEINESAEVYREHRFNVKLPAKNFTTEPSLAKELAGESILVQGVIDCFFTNTDGSVTLLDYKTDFIPRDLTRVEAGKMIRERHQLQLSYYRTACEKICAKKVTRCCIYSFGLGAIIEL